MTVQIGNGAFIPQQASADDARTRHRATILDLLCLSLFLWHASGAEQFIISRGGPPPILFQLVSCVLLCGVVGGRLVARIPVSTGRSSYLFGFAIVLVIYATWTVINFLYGSMSEFLTSQLRSKIIALIFVGLFAYLLSGERMTRAFSVGCAALACLGALINLYDVVHPTFSTTAGRAAGLYLNPNIAGFMAPCLGLLAMRGLPSTARHVVWTIVCIGTVLTFSRAAYLFIVIATLGLSWLGYLGMKSHRYVFAAIALPIIALFLVALSTGAIYDLLTASPLAAHLNENSMQRLGGAGLSVLENESTTERAGVAALALEYFLSSPLIGHGFGATFEWDFGQSTHNMYLLAMADGGVVGLLAYLLLIGYVSVNARGVALLMSMILILHGMFNHNVLDDLQQALIIAAIASIRATTSQSNVKP